MNDGPGLTELRTRVPAEVEAALERAAGLGFLGPATTSDQIDHSLGFAVATELTRGGPPAAVLDLGTGGGLPGLVLGACWPRSRTVLLEAGERKSLFLREVIAGLPEAGRVEMRWGRAEDLAREQGLRGSFDLVTARSFGSPAVTAECGSPFLVPGGLLVVSEPPPDSRHERWPERGLASLGLEPLFVAEIEGRFGFQVLRRFAPIPDRYPRRAGVAKKRPLF